MASHSLANVQFTLNPLRRFSPPLVPALCQRSLDRAVSDEHNVVDNIENIVEPKQDYPRSICTIAAQVDGAIAA